MLIKPQDDLLLSSLYCNKYNETHLTLCYLVLTLITVKWPQSLCPPLSWGSWPSTFDFLTDPCSIEHGALAKVGSPLRLAATPCCLFLLSPYIWQRGGVWNRFSLLSPTCTPSPQCVWEATQEAVKASITAEYLPVVNRF